MARFTVLVALLAVASAAFGLTGAAGVEIPAPGPVVQYQVAPAPPTDPPFGLRVGIEIAMASVGRTKTGSPPSNACYEIDSLCKLQGWSSKLVTWDSINTTGRLANYDVIVTGDVGYSDNDFLNYQDTLKKWVRNGGGLVTLGWAVFGIAGKPAPHMDSVCAVKAIGGGYNFLTSGTVHITNGSHPITTGVSDFNVQSYGEYANSDTWPGAIRLGNYSGAPTYSSIACRNVGSGRSVYLGPIYFGTFTGYGNRPYYSDSNAVRLLRQAIQWSGMSHDVGCTKLVAPSGSLDSGASVTPACSVYNYGGQAETYKVRLHIGAYSDSATVTSHAPATYQSVTFANWTASGRGVFNVTCSTELANDGQPSNDKASGTVTVNVKDVGVVSLAVPSTGTYPKDTAITPKAIWRNYGTQAASFQAWMILADPTDGRVYSRMLPVTNLTPGGSIEVSAFAKCTLRTAGTWTARCSSYLVGDVKPANDFIDHAFTVSGGGGPSSPWYAKTPMPAGSKAIKDGGWLTYDAGKARIYASRGNKQPDFFSYNPANDSWKALSPWLPGTEGKLPQKSSAGCATGSGVVYAVKGNNTLGFYVYSDSGWAQKKDVPLGLSNKKLKGGSALAWSYKGSTGSPYLLKGYKNEFYKYNVVGDSWTTLTPAPVGSNVKWDKGSWLASDGAHTIYAFKAKYMELYGYNTETDSWSTALAPMPAAGSAGSKKAKDGSCGAYVAGSIKSVFALKGGNTREFWKYTVASNAWAEKETIPTGTFKKKVKSGAGIVAAGLSLYATKGNKSDELWKYVPGTFLFDASPREGVMAGAFDAGKATSFAISPNPLASGFAVLRYDLPKAGAAELSVYNVTGQSVMTRTLVVGRSGIVNLDLRHLSNGVYLVEFSSEGFVNSQKLVVQR